MTFEQTLELSENAIFSPVPQNLSSRDNTKTYLAIALVAGLVIYGIYKLGEYAGDQQARLIMRQKESDRLKAEADKAKKT
jgi:hypothetical protein